DITQAKTGLSMKKSTMAAPDGTSRLGWCLPLVGRAPRTAFYGQRQITEKMVRQAHSAAKADPWTPRGRGCSSSVLVHLLLSHCLPPLPCRSWPAAAGGSARA